MLAAAAVVLALLLLVTSATAIFGEPETISPEGVPASEPQIAADERGNAIAVWTAGEEGALEVQARFRPAGGPWGPVETLSAPGEDSTSPRSCSTSATTRSWPGPASRRPRPTRPRRSRGSAPPSGPGAAASNPPRWCMRRAAGRSSSSHGSRSTRAPRSCGRAPSPTAQPPCRPPFAPREELRPGTGSGHRRIRPRRRCRRARQRDRRRDRREPAGGVGLQAPHRSVRGRAADFAGRRIHPARGDRRGQQCDRGLGYRR